MSRSKVYLTWLGASFIVVPTLEYMLGEYSVIATVFHGILIALLCFWWCGADAAENGITPATASKLLTGGLPIVGVSYYLLAGYGFKTGGLKLIKAIAASLVVLALGETIYASFPK